MKEYNKAHKIRLTILVLLLIAALIIVFFHLRAHIIMQYQSMR